MIAYLIKSACCAAVFLLAYLLFLEKEKMHRFNRWYLLASVALSLVIPLIQLPVAQDLIPAIDSAGIIFFQETTATPASAIVTTTPTTETIDLTIPLILIAYAGVACFLLTRFVINLYKLMTAAKKHTVTRLNGTRIVALKEPISSYTFLNTVFISQADLESKESEILKHEMAHVTQKHSLDILFIEIIRIIFWFNPLFIFYKRSIQLNHEFLADEAVVNHCEDVRAYQHLLLDRIALASHLPLGSRFNYSITKKRFIMMFKKEKPLISGFKKILVLPLLVVVFIGFCSKQIMAETQNTKDTPVNNLQKNFATVNDTVRKRPAFVFPWDPPVTKEGAPDDEINYFNAIVNANLKIKGNEVHMQISGKEREKLLSVYLKMNKEQRFNSKIGFQKKLNPPGKSVPTQAQLEKWKDPAKYGVWIDNKKVGNEQLNKYKPSDFSHYDASNLHYTEKMKKDVMTRFNLKVMYNVQLDLMTNTKYENWVKESAALPLYSMYYHVTFDSTRNKVVEGRYGVIE